MTADGIYNSAVVDLMTRKIVGPGCLFSMTAETWQRHFRKPKTLTTSFSANTNDYNILSTKKQTVKKQQKFIICVDDFVSKNSVILPKHKIKY